MKIIKKIIRNINIFALAILLSIGLFFLIKNPNFLQASILNLEEISIIQSNKRDIAYKQNSDFLDIFFAKDIVKNPITIIVSYDKDILLKLDNITSQCPFSIIYSNQDSTKINIDCGDFSYEESILIMYFDGDYKNILLEEAFYTKDNQKNNLSIGNLYLGSTHGNQ